MKLATLSNPSPVALLSAARVPRRAVVLTKERLHELGVTGVVFAGPDDSGSWRTTLAETPGGGGAQGGNVGVITIEGGLEQHAQRGMCEAFVDGYDYIEERYDEAIAAYQAGEIGRIVTVINSPGGVGPGLFATTARVRSKLEAAGVPTMAVADECMCSAAWAWGLVSDKLYAPTHARVGSIGGAVIARSIAGALAKEGIEVRVYRSGEKKMRPSGVEPFSEGDDADLQARADAGGEAICAWTAQRRGGTAADFLALKGAVFSGEEAARRGLTDGVLTAYEVIEMALKDAEQAAIAKAAGDLSPTASAAEIETKVSELRALASEVPTLRAQLAEKDAALLARNAADEKTRAESVAAQKRTAFAAEVQALVAAGRVTPASARELLGESADPTKGTVAAPGYYDVHGEAAARRTLALVTSEASQVPKAGAKPGAVPMPANADPALVARAKQLGADPNEYAAHVAGEERAP